MNLNEDSTINNSPADSSSTGQPDIASQVSSTPVVETISDASPQKDVKTAAAPSVADDPKKDDKKKSLLDTLKNVVEIDPNAEPSSEGQKDEASKDPTKPEVSDTDKDKEEKSEEDTRFDKHPRFQKLLKENKELSRDAQEYRTVDNFIKSSGLNYSEVGQGFEIMALMKNDPLKAREKLMVYVDLLDQFAGVKLPPDLKQRVDHGLIDMESAQEFAKTRNQHAFQTTRLEQNQRDIQAQREFEAHQQATQALQNDIVNSIEAWEQGIKSRDVDYAAKQPFFVDRVKLVLATNPPRNKEEAVAIAQRTYDDLSKSMSKLIPQRQPMRSVTSGVSSPSNAASPVPKNVNEAIRMGLAVKP